MPTAKTPADLPGQDAILSMSGLQFMQAMHAGDLPLPGIYDLFNFTLDHVESGKVTFRGRPRFQHCNPVGATHGGWYGTLLDSAMGCAVMTGVPQGSAYTT